MKSSVLRDSGEDWRNYVIGLMRAEGVIGTEDQASEEELRCLDKNRQDKKVSNEDCKSPSDPDPEITKMKDGTSHLAHKAEIVVDTESNLIVGAQIGPATASDTVTLEDSTYRAH